MKFSEINVELGAPPDTFTRLFVSVTHSEIHDDVLSRGNHSPTVILRGSLIELKSQLCCPYLRIQHHNKKFVDISSRANDLCLEEVNAPETQLDLRIRNP